MPKGKHSNHIRGSEHYRWNVARMRSTEGYPKMRVGYEHPLADRNGYAYEHLVIWVSAGNPIPGPDEVVRFRNGDKSDTRLHNLFLQPRRVMLAKNNVYITQDEKGRLVREGDPHA